MPDARDPRRRCDAGGRSDRGPTRGGQVTITDDLRVAERGEDAATAVERFAARHDLLVDVAPASRWADLVPLTAPAPGEQYGFEVDLDACTGCKACVSACHSLNGLAEDETWRRTGLLVGTTTPWRQTVTSACHHCVEPACLQGCPVNAYEKDPVTGIVRHLDDQCIGCSYCTLTCPYEVPRFDRDRGIVRKCDLCHDRLADGEAPACVQACPTEAIAVGVVDVAERRSAALEPGAVLVPGAPSSSLTVPTTTYRSRRPVPADARPADHLEVDPAHDHLPLAVMLVLTQLSVGAFVVDGVTWWSDPAAAGTSGALVALALGLLALAASLAHLGRPWLAWRAVLGLRRSWLSREIVAFGAYAGLAGIHAALRLGAGAGGDGASTAAAVTGGLAGGVGLAAVGCSVAVYAVTGRRWWSAPRTAARFAATTAICGTATAGAVALSTGATPWAGLAAAVVVGAAAVLALDASVLAHRHDPALAELARTAVLLTGPLGTLARWRAGLLVTGAALSALGLATGNPPMAVIAAVLVLAAELVGRRLWFLAVAAPRLPGELR